MRNLINKRTRWTKNTRPQPTVIKKSFEDFQKQTYTYSINLDERGSFYADVRNQNGKTVFEIKAGNELEEGETSIFEDGYMKHKNDLSGLETYLKDLGVMPVNSRLTDDR